MSKKKDIDISAEMKKVKAMLKKIPKERQAIANTLFNEIVFMQNTLTELKARVDKDGPVELFKQGKQEFYREHPALQGYNKTLQRYTQTIKQLTELLPPVDYEPSKDPLLDFIKGDD